MRENCWRFASQRPLLEPLSGTDELAELDSMFHRMTYEILENSRKETALLESARDMICSITRSGTILKVNEASLSMLGYTKEELSGKRLIDMLCPEDSEYSFSQLEAAFNDAAGSTFENRLKSKSGQFIDVAWSVLWSTQEAALICVLHDVSARKQAERLKDEIVQMVSHDLRAPLSTISSFLGLLKTHPEVTGQLTDKGSDLLQTAHESAETMNSLIQDLLDSERLEAGALKLQPIEADPSLIIEKACQVIASAAAKKNINLHQNCPSMTVFLDPDRIKQVLLNLLQNAVKFSPPGSTISIRG
ncbi:MAG: PAS domain S-box protein, partial [Candidatus Competibacteraceae bacterium]|nr:PAS domain S-box protein [Candidatus Competibacteraceae bacterium]